jgi:type II secretory pathway pseudopilin PulG
MENMMKKKMKKGITLIEIILAIVLIAIILGLTIPKLMSNSNQAEVKQVITNDVKAIAEAIVTWKRQVSMGNGSLATLSPSALTNLLPSNMIVTPTGYIMSSGLRTGNANADLATGVRYSIRNHFNAANTDSGTFASGMEVVPTVADAAVPLAGWDQRLTGYVISSFNDALTGMSGVGNQADFDVAYAGAAAAGGVGISAPIPCNTAAMANCYDNVSIR